MSKTSAYLVGLFISLILTNILWYPPIASEWLPDDLVWRNVVAQAADWAIVLTLVFIVAFWERETISSFGFRKFDLDTLWAGLGLGGFFMLGTVAWALGERFLASGSSTAELTSSTDALPPHFFFWFTPLALLTASVAEEMIFRGHALERLIRLTKSPVIAVILSQIAFGLYHLKDGLGAALAAAIVGSLFALYYVRYRNLTMTIIAHAFVDSLAITGHWLGVSL